MDSGCTNPAFTSRPRGLGNKSALGWVEDEIFFFSKAPQACFFAHSKMTYIQLIIFIKIHALFPEKLPKCKKKIQKNPSSSCNFQESEKKIPGSFFLSKSAPKVSAVYSGQRPILHLSFVEICSAIFCFIMLTNQPTNQPCEHDEISIPWTAAILA